MTQDVQVSLNLRKNIAKCYIWGKALYGAKKK